MSHSLTKHASQCWLRMLLVVVMALGFMGAYAQNPFELNKFYPDQTEPPQQLKESTSIYVYLTNMTDETLTITGLDMSLTQNGTVVAQENLVLKQSKAVNPGMQATPVVKVMDYPQFFDKCSPGNVTLTVYGVTYTDPAGQTQHFVDDANPLGSVTYKVSSNPTVTSTEGFESKVLYTFYDEGSTDGTFTLYFSEPVVETGKIQAYLEYGDANTTVITEVPYKLSADGMSLTIDFRGLDLSYDEVSQGTIFKDDNGNEYHPTKISLVVSGLETTDGTKITSKMTAPNGSTVIVTGAQFSWNYKEEKAPSTGGDDPNPPVKENLTITCNVPEGVNLMVEGAEEPIDAQFDGNKATIEGDVSFVRIYNIDPYVIESVKVDGQTVEANETGRFYFIEVTTDIKTIDITVAKQEAVEMSMNVMVEGLDRFINLAIMDKDGENGKALAMESQLVNGEAIPVYFTNLDLPLQIFGTWADGTDYKMVVTLDGEAVTPLQEGPTSALFMGLEPENGANLTISLTSAVLPSENITLTVNDAAGVNVIADTEEDVINVEFADGRAEVEGAQYIRIYNIDPYVIESVKVDGQTVEANETGRFYFIEVTTDIKTIDITVAKQEAVEMSMNVMVEGLDRFINLAIMDKDGENGKALAMESQLVNGEAIPVYFTNLDLPLQIFGTWADGTDYKMVVTLDGEAVAPLQEGPTSALFMGLEPENGANLTIALTGAILPSEKVTLTVNEAAGVNVIADTEEDVINVEFTDGRVEVEGAEFIRIYNVDPYTITSVEVNGEAIAAQEGGRFYFIEMTDAIKTIAITVEEQEVVEMSMNVLVEGLDRFENLVIYDKDGELGKALAMESQLVNGEAIPVYFTNLDLPLQIFGSWADGTDYKMVVTLNGEAVAPIQEGPTSALFMGLEPENGANLTIALTGAVLPSEKVTLTVNEAAGVQVIADIDDDTVNVEFADGRAEVEGAQFIRIYNVDPYTIASVEVNGEAIAAQEGGRFYFIEMTDAIKTIAITVEEQEVVEKSMNVLVEGLDRFESLAIMDKDGENGKALVMESQLVNSEAIPVYFTNLDLPLQIFGSWADGTDYKMVVTLDGEAVAPVQEGPTSALYMNIEPENGANLTIALTGAVLPSEKVTLTVNEAAGVQVIADIDDDTVNVEFADGRAEVEGAQFIRIYNVDPYTIASVEVNGEAIAAQEGGRFYFIEMTDAIKTIAITVEEQEVVEMSMNVLVEGLDRFESLAIMDKDGENGKALVMESQLVEGEAVEVYFTNLDLPLQIFGSWADGTDYKMVVTLNGEAVAPVQEGPTSALFMGLEPENGANLTIALTGAVLPSEKVTLTVNEAAGVQVIADIDDDTVNVEFADGRAEVEGAQFIRIYNVDPYTIASVEVNGEAIPAEEGGRYYFIEMTAAIETIAITVEEQKPVEMSMNVLVEGLDRFESLAIMDKDGENGKALVMESQLVEGEAVEVYFTNLDLPLQIFGSWADGTDYKMVVTLDGEAVAPVQEGPTSALFMNIEPENGANLVIALTGAVLPSEKVTLTVNDAAGVNVLADTEEDVINVEFAEGKAEVEGAQFIRIYNVEPYVITSVEVNGEAIPAEEGGRYYFIEMTAAIETIAITVEEQEPVEMSMLVSVEGLDRFINLAIMDKDGETGKALVMESQLTEGEAVEVYFTDQDLPLMVYGSWAEGTDYKMVVTLDGEVIEPVQQDTTSALFIGLEPKEGSVLAIALTGEVIPAEKVALTVNDAEGVQVFAENEEGKELVVFEEGKAEVEGAQFISIYNVEPYIITSVEVNGEAIAATEGGRSYLIELNASIKTIDITVEKQEPVEMSMLVSVEGLDRFINLAIMDKDGETGKALVMESQLSEGEAVEVYFTDQDLPLMVYGSWAEGTDYKMVVTLDGEVIEPVQQDTTSALFIGLEPKEGSVLAIALTGEVIPSEKVELTVNEASGVSVIADVDGETLNVEFTEGKAEVEGAEFIRIYNVDPYIITSVEVNGEAIAATEGGRSYLIEMTDAIKTIDITVEEQPVKEMTLRVLVEGLDRFEDMVIMDKDGETGKALAFKDQLAEGIETIVSLVESDLPLQIFGMWANGTNYQMVVTLDDTVVEPSYQGPNSALYMDVNVENDQLLTISLSGEVIPSEKVTLTVNEAEGVDVLVDTEEGALNVEFTDGRAEVESAQFIRIYSVDPYTITSVEVNGEAIAAEEGGRYYFIEMTAAIETIDITVEKQEVVEMSMMVTVEGLDRFENLVILDKDGEIGKALAMESQLKEGVATQVWFTNLDLPLQIFGSWADGTDYKMVVTLDGEVIAPVAEGPTSAQFINIEPVDGSVMTIALTGEVIPSEKVALTVNDAAGVQVLVDTEDDNFMVDFVDGRAEVEGAQFIRIYNVDPYTITSVKVNGEAIAAEEGGRYYFIEMTAAIETIDITVEEQEPVEMSMSVTVEGLDRFANLAIMDKDGENGKALAMEAQFEDGVATQIWFTNLDLPLQIFGAWADGTDYKMVVTLDGEVVAPVQEGPTSALYMGLEPQDGSALTIALTGAVLPSEKVALTVNEAAGVQVIADTEEDVINVEFADGRAEVEGAQYIRIYNVEPYIISAVKVNGEEIAAQEGGRYYFIEMTSAIETIDITVEEQEVVEMSMMVYVNGLDKFEDLVIMDKDGELGKALASKMNFEDVAVDNMSMIDVYFTNLDLPLQVYGKWGEGNDYQMIVMVDGVEVVPVQEGPTSALFMDIYVENEQFLTIELKGETSAINKVEAEHKSGKWFNLQGIEVNKANLLPGNVYINGGQKYLVK